MNKKILILTILAGLIGFGGTFYYAWSAKKKQIEKAEQQKLKEKKAKLAAEAKKIAENSLSEEEKNEKIRLSMSEKQLRELIFEVREKIQEYDKKLNELQEKEKRAKIAHKLAQKDIAELDRLRIELSSKVANLKDEQENLKNSLIKIKKIERSNLKNIAETYDKMEPSRASDIFINMSQMNGMNNTASMEDAIKILYYMGDRTKAKVLGELSKEQPKLAAVFSNKLKRVIEAEE